MKLKDRSAEECVVELQVLSIAGTKGDPACSRADVEHAPAVGDPGEPDEQRGELAAPAPHERLVGPGVAEHFCLSRLPRHRTKGA
jgi:hypothetical protein